MKPFLIVITALLLPATSPLVVAGKISGKTLHDQQCMRCHKTEVYSRPNRQIHSMSMLKSRVKTCYQVAGAKWNPGQVGAVIEYLNSSFYKFPTKGGR